MVREPQANLVSDEAAIGGPHLVDFDVDQLRLYGAQWAFLERQALLGRIGTDRAVAMADASAPPTAHRTSA